MISPPYTPSRGHPGPDWEHAWAARSLIVAFLAVRVVHLTQGYLDVATGWHAYRQPTLAAALAVGGTAESAWVITRSWRRGRMDRLAVTAEAAFGMAALLLSCTALHISDRTTSLNWLLPFTVGTAAAAGLALPAGAALMLSSGLAMMYLLSVWPDIGHGPGPATTAVVNAVSYLGFLCVATMLRIVLSHLAGLLGQARGEAVARGAQLAAERERARQRRLIHDSALQTLEAVAQGWGNGSRQLRQRALGESQRLRLALRDDEPGEAGDRDSLRFRLGLLAAEFAGRGLNVEYVDTEFRGAASQAVTEALCEAAREALVNVAKHAVVSAAVVRVATTAGGIELTVFDRGRGFDPGQVRAGFGIANSIQHRMTEVGGRAEIRSAPAEGTLVRLWSPA